MTEKYYKKYKLLKDTIENPKGTVFQWDFWRENYTSNLLFGGVDEKAATFSKEKIEALNNWFTPIGEPEEFYMLFPDDIEEHYYFGELRHNKMCKFCTEAQFVLDSDEYIEEVTKVFKRLYDKHIVEVSNFQ